MPTPDSQPDPQPAAARLRMLARRFESTPSPWILRSPATTETKVRLFCFPFAGGNALAFRPWLHTLPEWVEVCALQLPGRLSRAGERPFTRLEPLVDTIARDVMPFTDGPFVFFGHSMGGLVAFEVVRALRHRVLGMPRALLVSGCNAPRAPRTGALHRDSDAAVIQALRDWGGTANEVLDNQELLEFVLPTLRADLAVCETYAYQPEPPLELPISVFVGTEDPETQKEAAELWGHETTGPLRVVPHPGRHFFPFSDEAFAADVLAPHLHVG